MRHLGEVLDDRLVRDAIHAEHDRQLHDGLRPSLGLDDFTEEDVLPVAVRNLDADRALTRHGREDTHGFGFQVHRDVIRKVSDLLHAHTWGRLDLVTRDRRALLNTDVDAVSGVDGDALHLKLPEGLN